MRILKQNRRLILVNLILPFNLFIGLFILFTQILFLERNISENGLRAKKFLVPPLLELLENRDGATVPPEWLLFAALGSGDVIYNINDADPDSLKLSDSFLQYQDAIGLSTIINAITGPLTIVSFDYKGEKGIVVYSYDKLPFHFRIIHNPAYIGSIFTLTMIFFFLGLYQMNKYYHSVNKLVQASVRIANKDFDTEIESKGMQEMEMVFLAFDQMRKILKTNRERESRFVMSVTHDLKTPLAAMRMYLEAMKDGYIEIGGDARDAVGKILTKSEILEDRIAELLEYSKLQNFIHELQKDFVDMTEWLQNQVIFINEESRLHHRRFSAEINISPGINVSLNQRLMARALHNLIDNAYRYTHEDDAIRLSSYCEGDYCMISVEDSGPGIPPEEREKIFELFYRADKGRNKRGMGIGLASVKSIIENHGGTISCGDTPLGGVRFVITLPMYKDL